MNRTMRFCIIAILQIQLCCLLSMNSFCQDAFVEWKNNPVLHKLEAEDKDLGAVILEDFRYHEYKMNEKNEMFVYCEERRLIKVNDDRGIEMFNKIYVATSINSEVISIKARAIQPDGKIIIVPQKKILDVEENGRKYKKFAMEGVEKGGEIEYYTFIKYPLFKFGIEYFTHSSVPIRKARFALCVPEHLYFDVKGYNGFSVSKDTVLNSKRYIYSSADNLPYFESEKYSSTDPYIPNIQYKLSYNYAKDRSVRIDTWSELAKNVYANYMQLSEKEIKVTDNLLKKIHYNEGSKVETIVAIEDFIKTNFSINRQATGENADIIEKIIKSKVASYYGATRLMLALLQEAKIPVTIVYPTKRDNTPIDEEFENYKLVDDILLFFPSTGQFLDPVNISWRYPFVTPYWAGTKGLFIKETSIGSLHSALASFDTIPMLPYENSSSNLDVQMRFNKTMDTLELKSKQTLTGYNASSYRPAFTFLEKDKQDEFTKDIIGNISKNDSVTNIKVENQLMSESYKMLPLNIYGEIKSVELLERAGNKILIKVGEVIGTQEEMYQEKKRKLPLLLQFPHSLDRVISFEVPKGYRIRNVTDLLLHVTDKDASGETMGFISTYTLTGDQLQINLHEFYKQIYYPIEKIEIFRKVINAAADFNKVVLVLEKV